MKKLIALTLALCLILALCVPALAADITPKDVQIYYRGIKVMIDGKELIPIDGDGNRIEPFIIDGTTYMPLRAVATAFGLGVDWEDATSTAVLTTGGAASLGSGAALATTGNQAKTVYYRDIKITLDGKALTPKDSEGNVVEPFIMDGTTYLPLRAIATALGKEVGWEDVSSTAWLGIQPEVSGEGRWLLTGMVTYSLGSDGKEYVQYRETYNYAADGTPLSGTYGNDGVEPTYRKFYADSEGRVTMMVENKTVFTYEYDSEGRISSIRVQNSYTSTDRTNSFTYNDKGQLTRVDMTNKKTGETYVTSYAFDSAGRCLTENGTQTIGDDSSSWSGEYVYTLDANGRPEKIVFVTPDSSYFPDDVYDIAYNDAARTVTYSWNIFSIEGDNVCTFDSNGNLIRIKNDMERTEYTYAFYPGSADNHITNRLRLGVNTYVESTNYPIYSAMFGAAPFADWN